MKITVAVITPQDYEKFNAVGMNAEACLADRVKLICQDDAGHVAESFMKQDEFDRLGLAYIEQHAKLEHSEVCDEWFMKCSKIPGTTIWNTILRKSSKLCSSASKTEQAERFTEVSRHSVIICVRYTPTSFLPSGIYVESAGYRRMVESQDLTWFSNWEIRRRRLCMTTGTALLPTRISSTKTSEKRLANSSFILKM